jgi:hypothetical protein
VLRFAESDADRIARILRDHGGFRVEDTLLLQAPDERTLRRVLIDVNARVREAGPALLFVYYSGHADSESLHLGTTRLPLEELRKLVAGSAAETRIVVLDACRSGALTRVKGGKPVAPFVIDVDDGARAQGVAFLSSSAAGEDSQESDDLGASFFTHFLGSGLLGAADQDDDGAVTLSEAFAYSAQHTLAATASTLHGPQHPTYRFDLSGREDLWLTRPGTGGVRAVLAFAEPGSYLLRRGGGAGPVVAEVVSDTPGRRVALAPGRYSVVRREADHLLQGEVQLEAGSERRLLREELNRVDYARVVRKGGSSRHAAASLFVDGGVRSPMLELGTPWALSAGARLDLSQLSLELRAGYSHGEASATIGHLTTREVGVELAALRFFDVGPLALGVGVAAGWVALVQTLAPWGDRVGFGAEVGPVVHADAPLFGRVHLRLRVEGMTAFIRASATASEDPLQTPFTLRGMVGLGVFL